MEAYTDYNRQVRDLSNMQYGLTDLMLKMEEWAVHDSNIDFVLNRIGVDTWNRLMEGYGKVITDMVRIRAEVGDAMARKLLEAYPDEAPQPPFPGMQVVVADEEDDSDQRGTDPVSA